MCGSRVRPRIPARCLLYRKMVVRRGHAQRKQNTYSLPGPKKISSAGITNAQVWRWHKNQSLFYKKTGSIDQKTNNNKPD